MHEKKTCANKQAFTVSDIGPFQTINYEVRMSHETILMKLLFMKQLFLRFISFLKPICAESLARINLELIKHLKGNEIMCNWNERWYESFNKKPISNSS